MTDAAVVLCCGEAVLDLVPAALADGAAGFRPVPGGGALNTAVALARQLVPTGFLGALSTDPAGRRLEDAMRAEGVGLDFARRSQAPNTLALATPLPAGTRFDLYDDGTAGRRFSPDDLPAALPDGVRALVFGGLSLIHPPAAAAFEALVARQGGGRLIWLDLNIRPALVTDAGSYRARLARLMRLAHVVKASDEDLAWLGLADPRALRQAAPGAVLIHTSGAAGAEAWWGALHAAVPAPPVRVVDTVGAGDIFNAGFLGHLWRAGLLGLPLRIDLAELSRALAAGISAASLSVARPGADAPSLEELRCAP